MGYVIGVDGGQSGTRCVIGRRDGTVLGIGQGSAVDHVLAPGGYTRLEHALSSAYRAAIAQIDPGPIDVVYLALSGVVPPGPEAHAVDQLASHLWPSAPRHISHDLRGAWAGAFGLRPGIVIVAGTGSAAFGVGPDEREARAGGWGYLFGDDGSGWWIVREAIAAALRAHDGTGPATALTALLLKHFQAETLRALVARIYAEHLDRAIVASATPLVLQAASTRDDVARDIVTRGAHQLAGLVDAVRRQLSWGGEVPIAPAGGLWHSALFADAFASAVAERDAHMVVRSPEFPPSVGAFLLALHAAGATISLETVRASWEGLARVSR